MAAPFPVHDPLSLAAGTVARLVLSVALLALMWGGVLWALAA